MNGRKLGSFTASRVCRRPILAAYQHEHARIGGDLFVPGAGGCKVSVTGAQVKLADAALALEHDEFLVVAMLMTRHGSAGF